MTLYQLWEQIGTIGLRDSDPGCFKFYQLQERRAYAGDHQPVLDLIKYLLKERDHYRDLFLDKKLSEPLPPIVLCKCCAPAVQLEGPKTK